MTDVPVAVPEMTLSAVDIAFIEKNPSAAMITLAADGTAKAARVIVAIVDGRLWSTGTVDRARTRRLLRDPRSTLFVFEQGHGYRSFETTVTIIDGPAGIDANVRLFRKIRGRPAGPIDFFGTEYDEEAFRAAMIDDGRIVYEFNVLRSSGVDHVLTEAPTLDARSQHRS
ncbi:hypothetical protein ND748_01545 [Frankia sp. AiPs1]|uniref:hypothetical protein n=1 Tax=Frankia sp. AiPs1 TaxID=573493 RepID=UPI002043E13F|nr:hypothetical protein [Frankia sp. AiPs1]MCM3920371.1 hypothetical protein [Frankia sp. AiPs1]